MLPCNRHGGVVDSFSFIHRLRPVQQYNKREYRTDVLESNAAAAVVCFALHVLEGKRNLPQHERRAPTRRKTKPTEPHLVACVEHVASYGDSHERQEYHKGEHIVGDLHVAAK